MAQAGTRPVDKDARVVLVTGPAGAGRTTAIHAFEDFGFEAIDNLPLSLLPRLLDGAELEAPLAVGIDPRNRDFSAESLLEVLAMARGRYVSNLLYIDCTHDVLLQRFSDTRRRHPMARNDGPRAGIDREVALLAPLKDAADEVIDTTNFSPHELKAALAARFSAPFSGHLSVLVQSFSYRRGIPRDAEMVLDMRFLRNPHWQPELRAQDGRAAAVGAYIEADERFQPFFDHFNAITSLLLPAYKEAGKAYFSIAFGCTGGQHRSVFAAELARKALAERDWQVSIRHRELERAEAGHNQSAEPGVGVK